MVSFFLFLTELLVPLCGVNSEIIMCTCFCMLRSRVIWTMPTLCECTSASGHQRPITSCWSSYMAESCLMPLLSVTTTVRKMR